MYISGTLLSKSLNIALNFLLCVLMYIIKTKQVVIAWKCNHVLCFGVNLYKINENIYIYE